MLRGDRKGRRLFWVVAPILCTFAVHSAVAIGVLVGMGPSYLPFVSFEPGTLELIDDRLEDQPLPAPTPQPPKAEALTVAPERAEPPPERKSEPTPAVVEPPEPSTEEDATEPGRKREAEQPPEEDEAGDGELDRREEPSAAAIDGDTSDVWRVLRTSESGLGAHVPADARLAVWIDMEALRTSPHREAMAETLANLDGLHAMIGWTGIDPMDDLDEVVVATRNPYGGNLYLVARLAGGPTAAHRLAALGDRARRIELSRAEAGPLVLYTPAWDFARYVVIPVGDDVVAVYPAARARTLLEGEPTSRPALREATELLLSAEPGDELDEAPDFLIAGTDVEYLLPMIRWGKALPAPESLRVIVHVEDAAEIYAEMLFATPRAARLARSTWSRVLEELRGMVLLRLLGVTPLLGRIEIFTEGPALRGTVRLQPDEVVRTLDSIRPLLWGEDGPPERH